MKNNIDTIFSKDVATQVPVFYRFFTQMETENVGELRVTTRFSTCERHFSSRYINAGNHKPISDLDSSSLFSQSHEK
jgi:hypothetical protein